MAQLSEDERRAWLRLSRTEDVNDVRVSASPWAELGATGTVRPNQTTTVSWQTSGRIGKINVSVGDKVSVNQVLAELDPTDLETALRGFVGSRRRISFITDLEPLLDTLIHIQDICRPLGVEHPMPPEAAAAAADRVISTPWPLRRWGRQPSIRRIATDTDWAHGAGPEVYATVEQHLLMLTGRQPTPDI